MEYIKPEIEIIEFKTEDIIITSGDDAADIHQGGCLPDISACGGADYCTGDCGSAYGQG